ncbi:MAG: terminase small subunit [Christensenellaceae bacterium]|nr:terminase small subunit [Christensenellaceae bacterium]
MDTRQRLFAKNIACGMNGKQAAKDAGYSERSAASMASRLLKRNDIKEAVDAYVSDAAGTLGITPLKVLTGVVEIYERCMQKNPVMEWDAELKEYVPTGEWQFNSKGALKASELFMKYLKMFSTENIGNVNITLSDADRALLERLQKRECGGG